MLQAIPLLCPDKRNISKFHVGSGFLYEGKSGHWLLTVAHIALGTKPHMDWTLWSDTIHVSDPAMPHCMALFANGTPNFRYLPNIGNLMPDLIAVPVAAEALAQLTSKYRLFGAHEVKQVRTGDAVRGYGYPSEANPWPGPQSMFSAIAEAHFARIRFNYCMPGGFSGGPLVDGDGNVVGVLDCTDDQGRGLAWELELFRQMTGL